MVWWQKKLFFITKSHSLLSCWFWQGYMRTCCGEFILWEDLVSETDSPSFLCLCCRGSRILRPPPMGLTESQSRIFVVHFSEAWTRRKWKDKKTTWKLSMEPLSACMYVYSVDIKRSTLWVNMYFLGSAKFNRGNSLIERLTMERDNESYLYNVWVNTTPLTNWGLWLSTTRTERQPI